MFDFRPINMGKYVSTRRTLMSRGISRILPYTVIQFTGILLASGALLYGIVYVIAWALKNILLFLF